MICENEALSLVNTSDPILYYDEYMSIDALASIPQENDLETNTRFSSVMEVEVTEQGLDLGRWIEINEQVTVTPIHKCYDNP